jgi:hypothetical protein
LFVARCIALCVVGSKACGCTATLYYVGRSPETKVGITRPGHSLMSM